MNPHRLRIADRGERLHLLCYQEPISSTCGPSCQGLVQEPGKEADSETLKGGKKGCKEKLQK